MTSPRENSRAHRPSDSCSSFLSDSWFFFVLGVFALSFVASTTALRSQDGGNPAPEEAPSAKPPVSFRRDVAPILSERCTGCHGDRRQRGGYRVDTFDGLLTPGDSDEKPIVPGKPDESLVWELLTTDDADDRMPQNGDELPPAELELVRAWIEQGAEYDASDRAAPLATIILRSRHPLPPEPYAAPVPITALAFSPDGKELAASGYNEVTFWNPSSGEILRRVPNVEQRILALEWSPSGEFLAVAGGTPGRHGEVAILDPRSGKVHLRLAPANDVVADVAFDAGAHRVAVALPDGTAGVYEIPSGREILRIRAHGDWVLGVCFSPDGTRIGTASRDKTAKIFDAATGALVSTYSGHSEAVEEIAIDPDQPVAWTASADGRIHRFKIDDGKRDGEIGGFGGDVCALALEGAYIFSASADRTTRIHRRKDRGEVRRLEGHSDWVYSVAADPVNEVVASGSFGGEIRVWKIENGELISQFVAVPPPREVREF